MEMVQIELLDPPRIYGLPGTAGARRYTKNVYEIKIAPIHFPVVNGFVHMSAQRVKN
jgi:hypothetical protein